MKKTFENEEGLSLDGGLDHMNQIDNPYVDKKRGSIKLN